MLLSLFVGWRSEPPVNLRESQCHRTFSRQSEPSNNQSCCHELLQAIIMLVDLKILRHYMTEGPRNETCVASAAYVPLSCHRAVENRPLAGTSKPATLRCFIGRGRDRSCLRPPAQIRAGGITALGSYLEFWRRNVRFVAHVPTRVTPHVSGSVSGRCQAGPCSVSA